eukprot:6576719-Prymnesium_polylepis.1
MSVCAVREPMCAFVRSFVLFVRRNCPAHRDHRESVAKPPPATRVSCTPKHARVSRCHPRVMSVSNLGR